MEVILSLVPELRKTDLVEVTNKGKFDAFM